MKHKSLFFAVFSATILTTACEKNNNEPAPEPTPVMNIDVQVNVTTDFTAGVTLIPESADNEYFACILPEEEFAADSAAAAARILEMAGNAEYADFRFKGNAEIIFTDLEAATDYVVCTAVYGDETRVSSTATLTTDEAMERLEIITADIVDWGQDFEKTNAAFYFRLGDATLQAGENWDYWADGKLTNIWAVRKLESLDQVPTSVDDFCGIYKSSVEGEDTPGAIVTTGSSTFYTYEADGSNDGGTWLSFAEVMMIRTADGYALTAKLSVENEGGNYSCYYEGDLNFYDSGHYGIYNYKPSLQEDLIGLDYPLMKYAYYCGEENGMDKYSIACVNDPDGSSFGGYNKHTLKLEFLAPKQEDPYAGIPAGEYPVSTSGEVNTLIAGDYVWVDAITRELQGSYYYLLDGETSDQTQGFLTSGKVNVERDGDKHIFTIDAQTWDGYKITGISTQEKMDIVDELDF